MYTSLKKSPDKYQQLLYENDSLAIAFADISSDKYQQILYENLVGLSASMPKARDKYQQILYENYNILRANAKRAIDKYQQLLYKKRLVIVIFLQQAFLFCLNLILSVLLPCLDAYLLLLMYTGKTLPALRLFYLPLYYFLN